MGEERRSLGICICRICSSLGSLFRKGKGHSINRSVIQVCLFYLDGNLLRIVHIDGYALVGHVKVPRRRCAVYAGTVIQSFIRFRNAQLNDPVSANLQPCGEGESSAAVGGKAGRIRIVRPVLGGIIVILPGSIGILPLQLHLYAGEYRRLQGSRRCLRIQLFGSKIQRIFCRKVAVLIYRNTEIILRPVYKTVRIVRLGPDDPFRGLVLCQVNLGRSIRHKVHIVVDLLYVFACRYETDDHVVGPAVHLVAARGIALPDSHAHVTVLSFFPYHIAVFVFLFKSILLKVEGIGDHIGGLLAHIDIAFQAHGKILHLLQERSVFIRYPKLILGAAQRIVLLIRLFAVFI